jgi:hypothetical protein
MIGSLVGAWLAKQQVAHILLLGRSGRPGGDASGLLRLVSGGAGAAAAVHMARCDAASGAEVAAVAAAATSACRLQVRCWLTERAALHQQCTTRYSRVLHRRKMAELSTVLRFAGGGSLWRRAG